jgi:hypothetical protein
MIPKIVSNIVVNKKHVLTTNDWGASRTFSKDWVVQLHWKSFNVNPVTVGIVQVDHFGQSDPHWSHLCQLAIFHLQKKT